MIWGAYAIGASLLLYLPGALGIMKSEYFLFANPALALYIIVMGELPEGLFSSSANITGMLTPITSNIFIIFFVALSMLLLCAGAWGSFKLTERELQRMRRPGQG